MLERTERNTSANLGRLMWKEKTRLNIPVVTLLNILASAARPPRAIHIRSNNCVKINTSFTQLHRIKALVPIRCFASSSRDALMLAFISMTLWRCGVLKITKQRTANKSTKIHKSAFTRPTQMLSIATLFLYSSQDIFLYLPKRVFNFIPFKVVSRCGDNLQVWLLTLRED